MEKTLKHKHHTWDYSYSSLNFPLFSKFCTINIYLFNKKSDIPYYIANA